MEKEKCIHRWLIDSDKTIKLTRDQKNKHPNCIGRPSYCLYCGESRIQVEKIWDASWAE